MRKFLFNSESRFIKPVYLMLVMTCLLSSDDLKAISHGERASGDTIIHTDSEFPLRGIFYYAWYPNNWAPNGYHVTYNPTYGYYDNNDRTLINNHINELEYGNVDVVIASWWGLDNANRVPRDSAIKKCMEETDRRTKNGEIDLKWAIYYELEAFYNEPLDTIRADLDYLMKRYVEKHNCYAHIDGKPVIFVYSKGSEDNTNQFTNKWADAVDDKWYYVLKIYGGYRDALRQPSSWHQYGPSTRVHRVEDSSRKLVSYNISPGFKHADPNNTTFLERASEELWTDIVKEMVGSEVNWQLITSYNEWGEGTSVESAAEWQTNSGYGMYLDVLHTYATLEDITTSDYNGSIHSDQLEDFPFTITNKMLQINQQADNISVYSMTGRLIFQEKNISSLALDFIDRFAILNIEVGKKTYRLKYVNL
ncbi:MAG: hypothetical protein MUC93_13800 [Bacteroidales bacterium]|jgi:hypothetical protein|nr:hypothetical protein [Bacteroidales bacterium]